MTAGEDNTMTSKIDNTSSQNMRNHSTTACNFKPKEKETNHDVSKIELLCRVKRDQHLS